MPWPVRPVPLLLPVLEARLEPVVPRVLAPVFGPDESVPVWVVVPFLLRVTALRALQEVAQALVRAL